MAVYRSYMGIIVKKQLVFGPLSLFVCVCIGKSDLPGKFS